MPTLKQLNALKRMRLMKQMKTAKPLTKTSGRTYAKPAYRGRTQTAYDAPANVGRYTGNGFPRYNQPTPFPLRMRVKMSYANTNVISTTNINTFGTETVFNLNQLPTATYALTQMKALYNAYRVWGVNIDVTFSNPNDANGIGTFCGAMVQPSQGSVTLAGLAFNNADGKVGCDIRPLNSTGQQLVRIQRYFKIWELETMRYAEWVASADYIANSGGSFAVAAIPTVRIAIANDATVAVNSCTFMMRLTYDVEWFNRVEL